MKLPSHMYLLLVILFAQCNSDSEYKIITKPAINFTHHWNGEPVSNANFNSLQFTNENGSLLSIEKLRYLISNITFYKNGETPITIKGYKLINVGTNENTSYVLETGIPGGTYDNVSFTFGFDSIDNTDGMYPDLNTALWNVPAMLGGGYHFMQLEGKFINALNAETGYQYHIIQAVDISAPLSPIFQDTSFTVNLGSVTIGYGADINIEMGISEWFKNPNQWNLNTHHTMLMPNFQAQIAMYENGQNVFKLME